MIDKWESLKIFVAQKKGSVERLKIYAGNKYDGEIRTLELILEKMIELEGEVGGDDMKIIYRDCVHCKGKMFETARTESLSGSVPTIGINWLCLNCGETYFMYLKLEEEKE